MGDNLAVIDLGSGRTAVQVAVGIAHSCALLDDASVKCWGYNTFGSLGQGGTIWRGDEVNEMGDNLAAIDLGFGRSALQVAAGDNHSCALLDNGSIKCWGYNFAGQLGQGDTTHRGNDPNEMGDNLNAIDL